MTQQSSAPESVATILFPSKEEMLFCYGFLLFDFSAKFDHILLLKTFDYSLLGSFAGKLNLHVGKEKCLMGDPRLTHWRHASDPSYFSEVVMDGISGSSTVNPAGKKGTELERLMKQHEEKHQRKQELMLRRQELKRQIEKHNLEKQKNRESTTEEGKQVFKQLSEEYNSLREEYNELLTQRTSREHE
ncbi:hypothetical protein JRO89_XS08G0147300 [Xanthoceras sorbifolium]|uniref:Uncharacterized protein n=1 Tax=Xanthoceras sorbifolium TaxID=99658 RepID=A0ABQ8HPV0_9ROSI|nr:hypothetical protein JRO89_XS08G0147300 [Xanthoceras sorbifolium]